LKIKISQIIPDPNQPRKTFKDETLQELKDSYGNLGLIQPITVRPVDDKYMIVIGERRYRASLLNGQKEVECIIREDINEKTAREMQFAENSQQEAVPSMELGESFVEHRKKYKMTQRDLAKSTGLSSSTIERYENLCTAAVQEVQAYVRSGELDTSTASEISTVKEPKRQAELAKFVVNEGLNRSAVRKLKPQVEAQPHRPVANIYASQVKPIEEVSIVPEAKEIIRQAELPANLIELKMELDMVTTRIVHLDFKNLDAMSPSQALMLWQAVHDEMQETQRLLNYLNTLGNKTVRRLK
jgi:ParB family chromosome partitioning protein